MKLLKQTVAVLAATVVLSGQVLAQDIAYTLNNFSSLIVVEFYTSPADSDDWEEDILGADVLAPGESGTVNIADGRTQCDYDLLFVMSDGQEVEDTVNICELGSYTLQ
ncbi:hypothetical protein [Phaeovulum sp.]|uniref:hypothetical protein n=1 Tax=Phaeovulum sp. TaxID=2934796 RepID=UPI003561C3D5